jgi:hypothetical protein
VKIYIANKMTGIEDYNFPWFDRARDYLNELGHDAVSPADLDKAEGFNGEGEAPENMTLEACLRRDFAVIVGGGGQTPCDAMAFGPDWAKSTGAPRERMVAQWTGCSMWRVDPDQDVFYKELTIGLAGYARAGKDTVAQMITTYGFEQRSFAAPLKNSLYALDPLIDVTDGVSCRVAEIVDAVGWENAKSSPEIRQLLQRLGTEAGRKVLGQDVWVNALFTDASAGRIVVSDVRFPNEAAAIKARGGLVWRVQRPGTEPVNAHPSETAIDDWDYDGYVMNDGDIGQLEVKVKEIVSAAINED